MPLLVNKLIFGIVPTRAPFLLRPILRSVFDGLDKAMISPRLKAHADYVGIPPCNFNQCLTRCRSWKVTS